MNLARSLLVLVICCAVSWAVGRYYQRQQPLTPAVSSSTITTRETVTESRPDGTTVVTQRDKQQTAESTTPPVVVRQPNWRVTAIVPITPDMLERKIPEIEVSRRVAGPVWVAISWDQHTRIGRLGVGVEF